MARTSRVKEWMSQVGSSMKSYLSGETPAQKTGRLGLGHSTGYGGMKDPRWGMGGADYMHMQERRPLDLHGYNRGGAVTGDISGFPLRNPKTAPLRAAGHFISWLFRAGRVSPGLGHSGGFGGFGPGTQGLEEHQRAMREKKRAAKKRTQRDKPGARSMGPGMGGWDLGIMASPQHLFSKPPELGLGWGPRGLGGFDTTATTMYDRKRDPYRFMQERGKGFHGYNRGGNVDSVLGALTPGEFVMRREAVRKYGERFMNDINLQKLNQGGSVGAPAGGGGNGISQAKDLERGAALAGESILNAFTQGSQMVGDAIREALAPENLAAQIGDAVSQKMQESLAATSIEMKGNMGVDVRLSGNGATGDMSKNMSETIKNAIAGALNSPTNSDGSAKDPSLHQPKV